MGQEEGEGYGGLDADLVMREVLESPQQELRYKRERGKKKTRVATWVGLNLAGTR